MTKTLTVKECKSELFKIGIQLGVSPTLISTRLLSKEDKHDMLNGLVPVDSLMTAVKCWMNAKMPDYANGHTDPYKALKEKRVSMGITEHKNLKNRLFKR